MGGSTYEGRITLRGPADVIFVRRKPRQRPALALVSFKLDPGF